MDYISNQSCLKGFDNQMKNRVSIEAKVFQVTTYVLGRLLRMFLTVKLHSVADYLSTYRASESKMGFIH